VIVTGLLADTGGAPAVRVCVLPREAVEVEDTWHVLGMRSTGSNDFAVNDVFVPEEMSYPAAIPPRRGGRMFRTGIVGYLGFPLPAVALGIARRALDELTALATTTTRGYTRPQVLASRAAFHSFLGQADQRLKAARALMISNGIDLMNQVDRGATDLRAVEAGTRAAGAFAVRSASDVLADTVRFAGGGALRQGTVFERAVRDLTVAASHLLVNESAYENHAQFLLGLDGADPMA
jgi:alkylation response protein AidB-like acyl-CoA dehydrogenase